MRRHRTRERVQLAALAAVALAAVVVFLPIAFRGLPVVGSIVGMPDRFFDGACAVGAAFGTRLPCYGFVWNAFTTGAFIGLVGPIIGTYLVHREMALIGETLAHAAFAGVAFGTLFAAASGWSAPLLASALVAGVLGALGVQFLAERTGSYGDVPIAIMLTGSFAVGTLVIGLGGGFATIDIHSVMFGSIATVRGAGVTLMGVLTLLVVGAVALTYKQLLFITFDEEAARVARLNVSAYNALLVFLTAMVVVGAMQILGVILVAAMLVVPVAAASQVADSFRETMSLSIIVGETSVLAGLALAWRYSLAAGATIVIVSIAVYLAAVFLSGRGVRSLSAH